MPSPAPPPALSPPGTTADTVTAAASTRTVAAPAGPVSLDALDHRILDALQVDASLTNLALARRVHASAPTCLRRVRRLRELGVIQRMVALVDPAAVGQALTAIIEVSLDRQDDDAQRAFAGRASADPEVRQCYRVSPGPDFVLIAHLADMPAYQALSRRLFAAGSTVRSVRSFFAIERCKFDVAA